jgi:hypothetical protein
LVAQLIRLVERPGRPLKNRVIRGRPGNEALISSQIRSRSEPPPVGGWFIIGRLGENLVPTITTTSFREKNRSRRAGQRLLALGTGDTVTSLDSANDGKRSGKAEKETDEQGDPQRVQTLVGIEKPISPEPAPGGIGERHERHHSGQTPSHDLASLEFLPCHCVSQRNAVQRISPPAAA